MIRPLPCLALILMFLGGCGNGNNDEPVAVSPSSRTPVENPAPVPTTPPAGQSPAPNPTPAPPGSPAMPDAPSGKPKASVRGDVLIAALTLPRYGDPDMSIAIAGREGYPSTQTFVDQVVENDPAEPQVTRGSYSFSSAGYMNRGPFIETRYNLGAARVFGSWAVAGSGMAATLALSEEMQGDTGQETRQLLNPNGLAITAGEIYELDETLGLWKAPAGTANWKASLQVQSDYSDDLFRLCWRSSFPSRTRTSCGVFDRDKGELRGIHVVDDSLGIGRLVWRSRNLPPAPAGVNPSVSGDVLIRALSRPRYSDPVAGAAAGRLTEGSVSTATFVEQRVEQDDPQNPVGRYMFISAGYMNRDPFIPPRYDLRHASVTGRWQVTGSGPETVFTLFDQMEGDDGQLTRVLPRPGVLAITAAQAYDLDQTLAQWTNTDAPYPWDAALAIYSDDLQPELFRLCWQMTYYPQVFRQSCGLFDRQSGEFMGVHVVDDSENQGPLVWRSAAPSATPEPEAVRAAATGTTGGY